jgi:transketolase
MSPEAAKDLDQLAINTLRFLAVDMVEKANSGHPGAPMGQAAMAYTLWTRFLRHDPQEPRWPNRDRFVLSCGHASALLYSLLHLSGYNLTMEDLQSFRQLDSKTPGHPEYDLEYGVETTTGPLGQGLGNAVGMAIAERLLADQFNREEFPLFDHDVWVFASDGDIMEGVASEASSLAGHLGLGNLIVAYDDNGISIDGPTSLSFSEDVPLRYTAYGWHTLRVDDGNDPEELTRAFETARAEVSRPSLIAVRTHIGYGSPNKQDTAASHGSPLGKDELQLTKEALGWPAEPAFHVPDETREAFLAGAQRGALERREWQAMFERYQEAHPGLAAELQRRLAGGLPAEWDEALPTYTPEDGSMATRKASGAVLNAVGPSLPQVVGGSADLAPSNNTYIKGYPDQSTRVPGGRNLFFGVREHAMGSILNGMALSGLLLPYGGTFLIFSDYMRPAIRLAALMGLPVKYVFTHDSIFLGEDGPTHQPISQLLSLRAIPCLTTIRPADANETVAAWRVAIERLGGPTALALSRQSLPILAGTAEKASAGVARGGYVLSDPPDGDPQAILIASGSEVALCVAAQQQLADAQIAVRVVSLPSWELFEAQSEEYRQSVLPRSISRRLAVEAGVSLGWERYTGGAGDILGIDGFGGSAPYQDLANKYGFTVDNVVRRARRLIEA